MKSVIAMLMALMMIFACTFGAFAEAAETTEETVVEEAAEEATEEVAEEATEEAAAEEATEETAEEATEETAEEATEEAAEEATEEAAAEEEPAVEPVVMYVGAQGGLKIREAADLNSKSIMAVMVNLPVNVYAIEGKWAKVSFNWTSHDTVVEGYMWADYLSEKPVKIVKKTAAKKAAAAEESKEDESPK